MSLSSVRIAPVPVWPMGHKDNNMALDVYSEGLRIEHLVESINKLTYGEEVDSFIKGTLEN